MITTLDWIANVLVPTFFQKLDNWYLASGVTVLGLFAALFVIWYIYRRFT